MLDKNQVLAALQASQVPRCRHIYEIARPAGHFHLDYATYAGGTTEEVPRIVIDELEREGLIEKAYPNAPGVNAWKLASGPTKETRCQK